MRYGTTSSPGMAKDLSYFFRQNDRDDDAPRQISFHIIDSYNTSEEEIASLISFFRSFLDRISFVFFLNRDGNSFSRRNKEI